MDYYQIGQRVRHFRKAQGLSQEQLAEKVGISLTHMSHIETGNTKLSLPVLVDLAQCLQVQTDVLLFERPDGRSACLDELSELLDVCTPEQLQIATDILRATVTSMKKHLPEQR